MTRETKSKESDDKEIERKEREKREPLVVLLQKIGKRKLHEKDRQFMREKKDARDPCFVYHNQLISHSLLSFPVVVSSPSFLKTHRKRKKNRTGTKQMFV